MYLQQGNGNRPYLNFRTDEPKLLYRWFCMFPVRIISEVYKLDHADGTAWREHFSNFVLALNNTGSETPGIVPARNRDRSEQLFEQWMVSSEDAELFKTVKLSAIKALSGMASVATLIDDVYCVECEEAEPALIYLAIGLDGDFYFPRSYAKVGAMLDRPLFGYPDAVDGLEMPSCHVCRPSDVCLADNMASLARRKFAMCKCAPCRGRL